jgi:hypothetical protein
MPLFVVLGEVRVAQARMNIGASAKDAQDDDVGLSHYKGNGRLAAIANDPQSRPDIVVSAATGGEDSKLHACAIQAADEVRRYVLPGLWENIGEDGLEVCRSLLRKADEIGSH